MVDGLSSAEAARRLASEGRNILPSSRSRSWLAILGEVLREPMIALLLLAAVAYSIFGDPRDAAVLVLSGLFVVALTVFQDLRTSRALDALRDLSAPRALVVRDGAEIRIAGIDVVRGDAMLLHEGDRVAADAVVDASSHLQVDESLLTGEAVPAFKARGDHVFSGTLVVSGSARCTVHAIGARSRLGAIGGSLAAVGRFDTPLQREMTRLIGRIAVIALGVCALVGVAFAVLHHDWQGGFLAGISSAISLLPEEIPVILTAFFAMGAWRIARAHVLTRRLPAIEALGSATVLCSDKTGTLTTNRMRVARAEAPVGATQASLLRSAQLACDRRALDPMERAIVDFARDAHAALDDVPDAVRQYPMTREHFAVTYAYALESSAVTVAMKGAPEAVLACCALDAEARARIDEHVAALTGTGLRVLAVARGLVARDRLPDDARAFALEYAGLLALEDPVRPGVPEAIAQCATAGVRVMMITGDHASTAAAIARSIGIAQPDEVLTGSELTALSDDELARRIARTNVFARVTPEGKLRLVETLARGGDVVAMTGDGVNDAPALKAAHIGIAMGARGTDVAREAASIVLLDDDFTSIVTAIALGRRIFDNMRTALGYVIAVHVLIAGLALAPVLFILPLLLLPIHIVFIELVVDPTCSIAFEVEPASADIMNRPPRPPSAPILALRAIVRYVSEGVIALCAPLAIALYAAASHLDADTMRALTVGAFVVSNGILVRTSTARGNNVAIGVLLGAVAIFALALGVPALREAFHFGVPELRHVAVAAGICLLVAIGQFAFRAVARK